MLAALSAASFGVHGLWYTLAFGGSAPVALEGSGHAYLELAGPVVCVLLLAAAADVVFALLKGGVRTSPTCLSVPQLWLSVTAVLLLVFGLQELIEGALSSGHGPGQVRLLGPAGLIALPLTAAAGLVVALLLREADAAIAGRRVSRTFALRWPDEPPLVLGHTLRRPRLSLVAWHLAGRGPPAPIV